MTIQEINTSIRTKGNELAAEAYHSIMQVHLPHTSSSSKPSSSQDAPWRPWLILGGASAIAGWLGGICTDSSKISTACYTMAAVGSASVVWGYIQKRKAPGQATVLPSINYEEAKDFIIGKCNLQIDQTKSQWDKYMETQKSIVQNIIQQSSTSAEQREAAMVHTYYPCSISVTTRGLIDSLYSLKKDDTFLSQVELLKSRFAQEVQTAIMRTVNEQIKEYEQITL